MSEHEFELREVSHDPQEAEGERVQESVVGDVAVAAVANVGMLGYAAAAFHRGRHDDVDGSHEAEMAALHAQINTELRLLRAQGFGVGTDDYSGGFGPDDYSGGFSADQDDYGGFGVE